MSRLLQISPVLWTCLCIALPVAAQENPPVATVIAPNVSPEPEFALDELIRLAIQNNPQLPVARENLEAARQRLSAARSTANPVLQIVPGFAGNREARDEEIILSQPLDLMGKRSARAGVAGAEVRRAAAENTLAERSLIVAVKNAATELFAAQEAESLGNAQVEIAQVFRDAAARRAQLGDVPPVQVQRAELELLRLQNELTNAQAERLARRAGLNQLIGQAPEMPLRVTLPISAGLTDPLRLRLGSIRAGAPQTASVSQEPSADTVSAQPAEAATLDASPGVAVPSAPSPSPGASSLVGSDLLALRSQLLPGLSNRPDILGAQATLEARRAQAKVLRRERLPDIELQARRSSATGSGSTALRAVIVMPLFDFGSSKRERRAVEAEARAQEAQVILLRSQAASQVEQALIRLQQQIQTVERYRVGIVPQTLDLLRKTQIGYAQGASSYLEVLDAQRTLRQVQSEYLQALVGTRNSEAQLEAALGNSLPANVLASLIPAATSPTIPGQTAPSSIPIPSTEPVNSLPANDALVTAPGGSTP